MAIVVDALNGTNPKVRKQAALIVVEAYKRLGKKTEQYLRSCKPATLKVCPLFRCDMVVMFYNLFS